MLSCNSMKQVESDIDVASVLPFTLLIFRLQNLEVELNMHLM